MKPADRAYRPDIDGLRTLAVVPVVLYHAGLAGFGGGFVGVDVFFVISGYLITGILLKDAEQGRFTILGFYDRRIRRIFPALLAVIATTLVAACIIMLPDELIALGRSAISTALFYSNIYSWREVDYFGPAPFENPLLHAWSLAVEEQFYILWPLVVALLAKPRWRRLLLPLTIVAAALSFGMALFFMQFSQKTAFYMFPPRAWELFLGAFLALTPRLALSRPWQREVAGWAGLALVLGPVFFYDHSTPFPGLAAVPPCLGAFLLILANRDQDTSAARLLSLKPMIFIGLLSYSLYLWHWPIFSLYELHTGGGISPPVGAALSLLALFLSWLTWLFVERPFRKPRHAATDRRSDQRRVLAFGALSIGLVAAAGLALIGSQGLPARLDAEARRIAAYPVDTFDPTTGCVVGTPLPPQSLVRSCIENSAAGPRADTVLVGDSHARAIAIGLTPAFEQSGKPLLLIAKTGCIPLPGATPIFLNQANSQGCAQFAEQMLETVVSRPQIRTVILASRWDQLGGYDPQAHRDIRPDRWIVDARSDAHDIANSRRVARDALMRAAERLDQAGKRLVIIEQVPTFASSGKKCLARALWHRDPVEQCSVREADLRARRVPISMIFREVAAAHDNVTILDPLRAMCWNGTCGVANQGLPLYRDENHLSNIGSRMVADLIAPVLIALD